MAQWCQANYVGDCDYACTQFLSEGRFNPSTAVLTYPYNSSPHSRVRSILTRWHTCIRCCRLPLLCTVPYRTPYEGFIRRFVGADRRELHGEGLERAARVAMENLEKLWVVGVVEQYSGFEEVLKRLLDPRGKHVKLWRQYAVRRYNS